MDPSVSVAGNAIVVRAPPHTRGWTPYLAVDAHDDGLAPPHTRGWTRASDRDGGRGCGSPAHAGMDLVMSWPAVALSGLPRTRGDGPCVGAGVDCTLEAPPHTRGWTLRPVRGRHRGIGSPAHAGMDPTASTAAAAPTRLPRTRGDGPLSVDGDGRQLKAPPHTRGWTRARRRHRGYHVGSPAHAGMDPIR